MLKGKESKLRRLAMLTIFLTVFGWASSAWAEFAIGLYAGSTRTIDSDVELSRPGGTELTFSDVSWDDESFDSPIYYGFRLTYWFDNSPNWGIAADLNHIKMVADLNQTVNASGTRNGSPVSGSERLGDTFSSLQFSHGVNLATLNGMYRWFPKGERDDTLLGRMQPYVGVGIGAAFTHVEVTVNGSETYEYQLTGPAFQGDVGLNFDIIRHLSAFAGYRFSYTRIDADLTGGGSLETDSLTHHFMVGLSVNL